MGAPIRVAHVMGKMVGGGVESFVMNYYRHIDRRYIQFDFIVDNDSKIVPTEEIKMMGGNVWIVPPYQDVRNNQNRLHDLFCNNGWTIVHSHLNALSVFPLRAAARAGVPVRIAHAHSTLGKGETGRNLVKRLLRPLSTQYPTNLFACSRHAGDWLFGANSNYRVISNAIEINRFLFDYECRTRLRRQLGISDSEFVVGAVGRLVTQKNYKFLIKTFKLLTQRRSDSKLVIVGDGPLMGELHEMCSSLEIEKKVLLLGMRNDVDKLYQVFDVFAMPSIYEGLGIAAIEAQASGLPCILSTAVPDEVDLSKKCSFIDLRSPEAWAEKIMLIDKSNDRAINYNAFVDYDIEQAAYHLSDLYRKMDRNTC